MLIRNFLVLPINIHERAQNRNTSEYNVDQYKIADLYEKQTKNIIGIIKVDLMAHQLYWISSSCTSVSNYINNKPASEEFEAVLFMYLLIFEENMVTNLPLLQVFMQAIMRFILISSSLSSFINCCIHCKIEEQEAKSININYVLDTQN